MTENEVMISKLRESVHWIENLIRDLETGKAKMVPACSHVWRHLVAYPERIKVGSIPDGRLQDDSRWAEDHVDFLKLWGMYLYISDECPKTGKRFVESSHQSLL